MAESEVNELELRLRRTLVEALRQFYRVETETSISPRITWEHQAGNFQVKASTFQIGIGLTVLVEKIPDKTYKVGNSYP